MKKVLAFVLSAAMCLGMSVTAFADSTQGDGAPDEVDIEELLLEMYGEETLDTIMGILENTTWYNLESAFNYPQLEGFVYVEDGSFSYYENIAVEGMEMGIVTVEMGMSRAEVEAYMALCDEISEVDIRELNAMINTYINDVDPSVNCNVNLRFVERNGTNVFRVKLTMRETYSYWGDENYTAEMYILPAPVEGRIVVLCGVRYTKDKRTYMEDGLSKLVDYIMA